MPHRRFFIWTNQSILVLRNAGKTTTCLQNIYSWSVIRTVGPWHFPFPCRPRRTAQRTPSALGARRAGFRLSFWSQRLSWNAWCPGVGCAQRVLHQGKRGSLSRELVRCQAVRVAAIRVAHGTSLHACLLTRRQGLSMCIGSPSKRVPICVVPLFIPDNPLLATCPAG